ncbi:MAG: hypothetical protein HOH77_13225 [Candidatus Latescibacteria bacterium]|nr:hypothetical protein [Candidatus Latescibacterota bacterium]
MIKVLSPSIINYAILDNYDRALHAHIHPRYDSEPEETRHRNAYIYATRNTPPIPFDYDRDLELIQSIREELPSLTQILK